MTIVEASASVRAAAVMNLAGTRSGKEQSIFVLGEQVEIGTKVNWVNKLSC
jgi:hypothetical protein